MNYTHMQREGRYLYGKMFLSSEKSVYLFLPRRPILDDSSRKFLERKFAFLCLITLIATRSDKREVEKL